MMDSNFGDHNAVSKFMLGWISPPVAKLAGIYQFEFSPSAINPNGLIIAPDPLLGTDSGEFYLIQFRKWGLANDPVDGIGAWRLLDGFAIWHVDATRSASGHINSNNSVSGHKFIKLMEASAVQQIELGNGYRFAPDVLYRDGATLSDTSNPNNRNYVGSQVNFSIDQIQILDSSAKFRLQIFGSRPKCYLDVNNDQKINLTQDGLIIARHLQGQTSTSLIKGTTVAANQEEFAIQTKLNVGRPTWDLTGGNLGRADIEGLILLRLMLGIDNTNLLRGITLPADSTVRTPAAIRNFINTHCGSNF
jgi:hypothetical protein